MYKASPLIALATITLITVVTGYAWSYEATPYGMATQPPIPDNSGPAPGWYPPPSYRSRSTQSRQQPSQWYATPCNYRQSPSLYAPRGPYSDVRAAPAPMKETEANLHSDELMQAQKRLAAKTAELDRTRAELESLREQFQHSLETEQVLTEKLAELTGQKQALLARVIKLTVELDNTTHTLEQHNQQCSTERQQNHVLASELDQLRGDLANREELLAAIQVELQSATRAMQQSRTETANSRQQLDAARAQAESLTTELTALKEQLKLRDTSQQEVQQTQTAEVDRLRSDLAGHEQRLATVQLELHAASAALQSSQSETARYRQQLDDANAQTEPLTTELTTLKEQLEHQQSSLQEAKQSLATVMTERDELQSRMDACSHELDQARDALITAQSEMEAPDMTRSAAIEVETLPTASMEPSTASEGRALETAETVTGKSANIDTDKDGIIDSADLCPDTQPGIAVEVTGCAAGEPIKLAGVNFLTDSYELNDKARDVLDRIAAIINQQPGLRLEVAGHTDAEGDPAYNQWLSLQRAEAVMDYLVEQGMNPRHIGATGYGGQRPIADNSTSEGQQVNRRVELRRLQ